MHPTIYQQTHDVLKKAIEEAAIEEYLFKIEDLEGYEFTGKEQFISGLNYAYSCLVMRLTGEPFNVDIASAKHLFD